MSPVTMSLPRKGAIIDYANRPLAKLPIYDCCFTISATTSQVASQKINSPTENQAEADWRIPLLQKTPTVIRFLSIAPWLERMQFEAARHPLGRCSSGCAVYETARRPV
jgi:hypothetical protein